MLQLPPSREPLRVVGIDPGTSTMGVAALSWDFQSPFRVQQAFTLTVTGRELPYQALSELHGNRHSRLRNQGEVLHAFLTDYRPHAVVCEAPYMGSFAQSFMALTEAICEVRHRVQFYDPQVPLYTIDPTTVKKTVGVKISRKMDKEDVRIALVNRADVQWEVPPQSLDEHGVDAVAVAMYFLLSLV